LPEEFGPHKEIINSVYQLSPQALEEIAQCIEQRGIRTPISQVVGYQQIKPWSATGSAIGGAVTTTSTSYTGLTSATASVFRPGQYLVFISANIANSSALNSTSVGLKINSTDPPSIGSSGGICVTAFGQNFTTMQSVSTLQYITMTSDSSTVQPVWGVTGGTGSYWWYCITVTRIGNAPIVA